MLEIIADDIRHVGIDRLVIGHTGADGVGQGHIAAAIGVKQPRHTQGRVATKDQRVTKVIVDAPVDHIDALQAGGGAHIDNVVVRHQIASLDQGDAHVAG